MRVVCLLPTRKLGPRANLRTYEVWPYIFTHTYTQSQCQLVSAATRPAAAAIATACCAYLADLMGQMDKPMVGDLTKTGDPIVEWFYCVCVCVCVFVHFV